MLLHTGNNYWIDGEEIILVMNVKSVFCPGSKTELKEEVFEKAPPGEKIRSLILCDKGVCESILDSRTLFKRDEVLLFTKE